MKVLLLILVSLAAASGAWAQEYEVLEQIDRLVNLSGIVMVADRGEVVYQQSFGFADHQSKQVIDEHTLFPLASLTKPFTAMAIGLLQEQGRLIIDDPVAMYLPEFASNPKLTIRNLIEHRSGLIRDITDEHKIFPYEQIPLEALIAGISRAPTKNAPGFAYQYSNANYQVLARLVEVVAHQSYESYLREYILKPAEMDSTTVLYGFSPPMLAKGYSQGRLLDGYHFSYAYGSGNLASTAADLHAFAKVLRTGVFGSPSNVLGWVHGSLQDRAYSEHTGHLGSGYATCLRFFEDDDLVVIVLLNMQFPDILEIVDVLSAAALELTARFQDVRPWLPTVPMLTPTTFYSAEGQPLMLQMRNRILIVKTQDGGTVYLQNAGDGLYRDPEHPLYSHHLIADDTNTLCAYELRGLVRSKRYDRVP